MNKKIIALAVAAVFSTSAFADSSNVEVYGQASISFDRTDNGTGSSNQISDNVSRVGFKGSEDLGNGLSAIFQIESAVSLDSDANGTSTLGTRDSFVGLSSSDMGTIIAGRHNTPYKDSTEGADVFHDTIADYRSLMGVAAVGVNHNFRAPNTVMYTMPAMDGFSGSIAYIPFSEGQFTVATASGLSLAAAADIADIDLSFAFQEFKNIGPFGDKQKAWKLGAGYTLDAININAVYENMTSAGLFIGNVDDHSALYLSGKYTMGSDAVKVAYARVGDYNNAVDTGAKQYTLGYDHSFSKRTTVFALYTRVSNDLNSTVTIGNNTTANVGVALGQNPSAWSFGVKHSF